MARRLKVEEALLKEDFPECTRLVQSYFRCVHFFNPPKPEGLDDSREMGATSALNRSSACDRLHSRMHMCIVGTFCPTEASALYECCGGIENIPIDDAGQLRVPWLCKWKYYKLDKCLVRRTDDFERSQGMYGEYTFSPTAQAMACKAIRGHGYGPR